MCDKGRRQSPINIDTRALVYDPLIGALRVDNNLVGISMHAIMFDTCETMHTSER